MTEQRIFNYLSKLEAAFTVTAATDVVASAAHGLVKGDKLQLTTVTTLPAGLSLTTDYFVTDVTTGTFKLSAVPDGTSVDITDTGTGTHTFHLKGKVILTDGFEHSKAALNFSGTSTMTIKFQGSDSLEAPDFNAAQSPTNKWEYLDIIDSEDAASIDGDAGIAPAGTDDNRNFTVNNDSVRWVTAVITAWTQGLVEVTLSANKQY